MDKANHPTYLRGDKVAYTGKSEMLYGAQCYEVTILDGHRKGQTGWTYRCPQAPSQMVVKFVG